MVRRPEDESRAGRLCRLLAGAGACESRPPISRPYVQDALDEIEYVTGGPDTKWGAERVKDGHPAPFKLTYVEIGNEDWFDKSGSYEGRYAQFYKAIKAKYPDLQLIATTPVKEPSKPDVHQTITTTCAPRRSSTMHDATTTRPTATARRSSSASGPRAKARPRPTSARLWAMRPG